MRCALSPNLVESLGHDYAIALSRTGAFEPLAVAWSPTRSCTGIQSIRPHCAASARPGGGNSASRGRAHVSMSLRSAGTNRTVGPSSYYIYSNARSEPERPSRGSGLRAMYAPCSCIQRLNAQSRRNRLVTAIKGQGERAAICCAGPRPASIPVIR